MPHVSKRQLQTRCAAASKKRKASLATRHPKDDTPYEDPLYGHTSDEDNFGSISCSSDWLENFSDAEDEWPIGEPEAGWKEKNDWLLIQLMRGIYSGDPKFD